MFSPPIQSIIVQYIIESPEETIRHIRDLDKLQWYHYMLKGPPKFLFQ